MPIMSSDPDATTDQRMTPATKRRPARPARDVERTLRNVAGIIRAQGRRPHRRGAGLNDLIDVPTLAAFADVAAAADEALRDAVHHLRHQTPPATWEEIGATLGVTKQAAYQRFGR